jgi:hypothetical protein
MQSTGWFLVFCGLALMASGEVNSVLKIYDVEAVEIV